jgi:hypothetical protein
MSKRKLACSQNSTGCCQNNQSTTSDFDWQTDIPENKYIEFAYQGAVRDILQRRTMQTSSDIHGVCYMWAGSTEYDTDTHISWQRVFAILNLSHN